MVPRLKWRSWSSQLKNLNITGFMGESQASRGQKVRIWSREHGTHASNISVYNSKPTRTLRHQSPVHNATPGKSTLRG